MANLCGGLFILDDPITDLNLREKIVHHPALILHIFRFVLVATLVLSITTSIYKLKAYKKSQD